MGSRHHSRKKQQPLALNPPGFYTFAIDERVLCYEPDEKKARVLYDSKVLDVVEKKGKKGKSQVEYKIHFLGWNSSWDRYVAEDCVLKDTEENRELQRTLKSQADALLQTHLKKKKRKKTYSEIMKEATKVKAGKGSTTKIKTEDSGKSSSSSDSSDADSDDDDSISQVILTDRVKYILEQDFYNITKRNMLLRIPAEITVLGVLEAYVKYTGFKELRKLIEQRKPSNGFYFPSSKNSSTTETKSVRTRSKDQNKNDWKIDFGRVIRRVRQAQEIVYGLKTYFDFLLYQILLYDVENEQYKTYKKMIPKIPVVNCNALLPRLPDPNRPNESNDTRFTKGKRGRNNKKIPGPKRKPESNTLSTGASEEPVAVVITKTGANKVKAVGRESRTSEGTPESKCDKAKELAVEPKSCQKGKATRRNSKTNDKTKPVTPESTPENIVEVNVQSKSSEKAKSVRRVSRTSEKATKASEETKPDKSKETQRRSKSCENTKGASVGSESLEKNKDVAQGSDSCQKGKVHSNEAKSHEKAKDQVSAQESASAESSAEKKAEKPKPTPSTSTRSQNATNTANNDLYVKKINQYMKELQAWQILPDECYTQDNTEPCMVYGLIHLLRLFIKLPDVLNRMQIPRRKVRVIVHHVNQLIDHIQTFYNFSTHRLYFTIPRCVYEEDLMGFGLPVSEQERFPPPQPATTIDISQYSTKHHRSVVLNRSIPALGKVVEVTLTNPSGLNQEHQITVSNESTKHICDSIPDSDEEIEIITDETRIFPSSKRATHNSTEFMLEPIPCTSKSAFPGLTRQSNDKENSDKLASKKMLPSATDLHAPTNSNTNSDEAVPNNSSSVTITEISDNKDSICDLNILSESLTESKPNIGVSSKVVEDNNVEPSTSTPRRNSLRRNSIKSKPVTKGKQTSNEESVTIKVEPPDEPVIEIPKRTGNNEARNAKRSTAKNAEHSSTKAVQPKKEIKKEKITRTPSPPPQPMVRQARKSAVNAAFKNAHILASEQNITARAISSSLGKTSPTSEMKARKRRASAGSSIKSTKRTKPPDAQKAQHPPARSSRERTNSPSKATTSQQSQVKIENKSSLETPKPKKLPERRHSSPSRKSKEKANETLNKFNATIAALQRSPERQVVTRHSRTRRQ